jgi:hypothetical protein
VEEASAALVAAKAALNPALVLDLPEEADGAAGTVATPTAWRRQRRRS